MASSGEARVFITATTDGLKTGVAGALRTLKDTFVPSAQTALRAFAAAATAAFGAAIVAAAKFEKEMSKVGSLLGDQAKTVLPAFSKGVRKLALETGQATSSLAAGLFDIVSAGVEVAESMSVLEESAKLAVGGFTTTDAATQALITTMQQFRGEITDAADAADFLFAVQKGGRLTVQQVATTIGLFASTGAAAGISARELGAAFASISLAGEGAEQSATQLRAIIISLQKDMDGMKKRSREAGVEIDFQKLKTEGLIPFLEQFKTLTGEQRAQIFSESRALRGLNTILGNMSRTYELLDIVTNRSGASQEAFARRSQEIAFQFDKFTAFVLEAAMAFGNELTPLIKKFFKLVDDNKEGILTFVEDFGSGIRKWADDLETVVKFIRDLKDELTIEFLKKIGAVIGGLTAFALGGKPGRGVSIGAGLGRALGGVAAGEKGIPQLPGLAAGGPIPIPGKRPGGGPTDKDGPSKFEKEWTAAFTKVRDGATSIGGTISSIMGGITSAMSQGFQSVFVGIAEGTASMGEILKGIATSFRDLMFKIIADILAKQITAALAEAALKRKTRLMNIAGLGAEAKAGVVAAHAPIPFIGIAMGLAAVAVIVGLMASFLKFAKGGIVPGIGTGDVVPAMLTPGEVVLNKAQQKLLLAGGGGGGGDTILNFNISGMFLEGSPIMWRKLVREQVVPELDRHGLKTRRTKTQIT